mmetsp:Transcript_112701/g.318478  ORF Transcript_112701/g.318478 Transcript_112701/m.318478 type:complete len:232 (+) Transcript_112701:754-1449(+)
MMQTFNAPHVNVAGARKHPRCTESMKSPRIKCTGVIACQGRPPPSGDQGKSAFGYTVKSQYLLSPRKGNVLGARSARGGCWKGRGCEVFEPTSSNLLSFITLSHLRPTASRSKTSTSAFSTTSALELASGRGCCTLYACVRRLRSDLQRIETSAYSAIPAMCPLAGTCTVFSASAAGAAVKARQSAFQVCASWSPGRSLTRSARPPSVCTPWTADTVETGTENNPMERTRR